MYKYLVVLVAWCAVSNARPHNWQMLPPVPGYIPVYIQHGDTPLEEINLELAEAFHAISSGRSASRNAIAASDDKEDSNVAEESLGDAPNPPDVEKPSEKQKEEKLEAPSSNSSELSEDVVAYKRAHEKKPKKAGSENIQKIPVDSDKN